MTAKQKYPEVTVSALIFNLKYVIPAGYFELSEKLKDALNI